MSNLGNKKVMAANIRRYMLVNDVTPTDICKDLNFKMPTFSDWIHARTYPRIDKIEKMANYFGIQKSDLIESPVTLMNEYLKKRRLEVGLTQKQVADLVDVSEATVSRWESGDIANMRRDRIAKLAEALRTTPTFIMTGQDEPAAPHGDELSPAKKALLDVAKGLSEEQAQKLLGIIAEAKKLL